MPEIRTFEELEELRIQKENELKAIDTEKIIAGKFLEFKEIFLSITDMDVRNQIKAYVDANINTGI